jgi:hypothetical protein
MKNQFLEKVLFVLMLATMIFLTYVILLITQD